MTDKQDPRPTLEAALRHAAQSARFYGAWKARLDRGEDYYAGLSRVLWTAHTNAAERAQEVLRAVLARPGDDLEQRLEAALYGVRIADTALLLRDEQTADPVPPTSRAALLADVVYGMAPAPESLTIPDPNRLEGDRADYPVCDVCGRTFMSCACMPF